MKDDYTLTTKKPQTFNATRVALAAAIGDYIDEPDKTTTEIMEALASDGEHLPTTIETIEQYDSLPANTLLKDIGLTAATYKTLMEIGYNAGKLNQELV